MSNTFYGVLNGNLTTSKNCRRDAVHAAVEANGFVWGVALAHGTLLVINRSKDLAEKWLADRVEFVRQQNVWRVERGQPEAPTDCYRVVKVYAGKAAAEAACQPAEQGGSFPGLWKRPGGVEETITAGSHFG